MRASRSSCDRQGGRSTTSYRRRIRERPTNSVRPEHEKDRAATRSSEDRRRQRRTRTCTCSVPTHGTETHGRSGRLHELRPGLSVIASAMRGAGDGTRPGLPHRLRPRTLAVSHAAIAAVLARDDLAAGERLVAFSLASFANREQLAWPGLAAATARAGLGRSRYLEAREQLVAAASSRSRSGGLAADGPARSVSCSRSADRGGQATLTRNCSRSRSASAEHTDRRDSYWLPSRRSRTRMARSRACSPRSCAVPPVSPTAPIVALVERCSTPVRSRSIATPEDVPEQTDGLCASRRSWPTGQSLSGGAGPHARTARARSSRPSRLPRRSAQ